MCDGGSGHEDQFVQLGALSALPALFTTLPGPLLDTVANVEIQKKFVECGGPAALLSVMKRCDKPDVLSKGSEVSFLLC